MPVRKPVHKRKVWPILFFILAVVVIFRAFLPSVVLDYVNKTLDRIPGYQGKIDDIDIALIRGAYTIRGLNFEKTDGGVPVPLLSSPAIDFSVEWRALFNGKVVGEVYLEKPELNFVNGPSKETSQLQVDSEWLQVVKDLFPLRINTFKVRNGAIRFRDFHRSPKVDVALKNVQIEGTNFTNTVSSLESGWATINGEGETEGEGELSFNSKILPVAKDPTFDLNGKLEKVFLPSLNDFLVAYAGVDADKGEFNLYLEVAAKEGSVRGYVKPLIKDLSIVKIEEDIKNPLALAWEGIVGFFSEVFKNQRKDQLGTRVEFAGSIKNPKSSVVQTILSLLENAFIDSLKASQEERINIEDVESN